MSNDTGSDASKSLLQRLRAARDCVRKGDLAAAWGTTSGILADAPEHPEALQLRDMLAKRIEALWRAAARQDEPRRLVEIGELLHRLGLLTDDHLPAFAQALARDRGAWPAIVIVRERAIHAANPELWVLIGDLLELAEATPEAIEVGFEVLSHVLGHTKTLETLRRMVADLPIPETGSAG